MEHSRESAGGQGSKGYKFQRMYPDFLATVKAEGNSAAVKSFEFSTTAKKVHYGLYARVLERVKQGKDLDNAAI